MIQQVSNQFLLYAYTQALALKLNSDFISLLEEELRKRNLLLMTDETGERKGAG
ncbi:sporulation histidine kinase inhibitor Sda [Halalkalibacter kiskunsagensis]|uniref:Sporulation histidine kinase inhibitor Sda n=1 Tax=Halalkalibacter kiskunsagensis TaxID=1548599 RepID=A0ABV6KA95_9BACI